MKTIKQRDAYGCGIACISMVADLTYNQMMEIAEREIKIHEYSNHATNERDIRILLDATGVQIKGNWRIFKSWQLLPDLAIVAVNKRKTGYWHWVVFERGARIEGIRDPKAAISNRIRTDLGRLRPFKYLEVKT